MYGRPPRALPSGPPSGGGAGGPAAGRRVATPVVAFTTEELNPYYTARMMLPALELETVPVLRNTD